MLEGNKPKIVPPVPKELSKLHDAMEERRHKSLEIIYKHPEWREHLGLIHDSIDIIVKTTRDRGHKNPDELVLKHIGVSLYNDCTSAYSLLLSGYGQISLMPLRELLEWAMLLAMFALKTSAIQEWKNADREERLTKFSPGAIRNFINQKLDLPKNQRDALESAYHLLCEYGTHPTYKGIMIMLQTRTPELERKGTLYWGPFVEESQLLHFLIEFARIFSFTTNNLILAFGIDAFDEPLKAACLTFTAFRDQWWQRYGGFPPADASKDALS